MMIPSRFLIITFISLYGAIALSFCQGGQEVPKGTAAKNAAPGDAAARTPGNAASWPMTPEAPSPAELLARAEQFMKAHAAAYPQLISRVELRNGDWAVLMRGKWFYYAGGRLLPEEERENAESWSRQSFYSYPAELPPWQEPEGERAERLKNVLNNRRANPPRRNPEFYDTMWQSHTRAESSSNQAQISFLGKSFTVHKELEGRLKKIDAEIREAAKTDPSVQPFIDNIGSIGAWNWRNVAATVSRSYHSYGVALDILPTKLNGLATYWQWSSDEGFEWYRIPYSKRYHPPTVVVKIFERYGFCWGGKWPLFDTMHFEYRPEIMLLYGMKVENP